MTVRVRDGFNRCSFQSQVILADRVVHDLSPKISVNLSPDWSNGHEWVHMMVHSIFDPFYTDPIADTNCDSACAIKNCNRYRIGFPELFIVLEIRFVGDLSLD